MESSETITVHQVSKRLNKIKKLFRHYRTTLDNSIGDSLTFLRPFIAESRLSSVMVGTVTLEKALKKLTAGDILFILSSGERSGEQWPRKSKLNARIHEVFPPDANARDENTNTGGTDILENLIYDKRVGVIANLEKRQDLSAKEKQFLLAAKIFPTFAGIIVAHKLIIQLEMGKRNFEQEGHLDQEAHLEILNSQIQNISQYAKTVDQLLKTGGFKLNLPDSSKPNDRDTDSEDDLSSNASDEEPKKVISFQEVYDRTCQILPQNDWYKSDEWYLILQDLLKSLKALLVQLHLIKQTKDPDDIDSDNQDKAVNKTAEVSIKLEA